MHMYSMLIAATIALSPGLAFAGGGASSNAPGTNKDAIEALGFSSVGSFIAGEIYGNTSNPRPSGNGVLPSLAPGPWACNNPKDCSEGARAGGSIGEFIGVGNADFANGTTKIKTNFGQPYQHGGVLP